MDKNIERNLVLGLVRIFSEYGWVTVENSNHFADKISYIHHGLLHGEANSYLCHLRMLIQARRKDNKWGKYTPTFVNGIETLLCNYAANNGLFDIESETMPVFKTEIPAGNIFKTTPEGKAALRRLRTYGKTNIRYSFVEEYGLERLNADLHAAGFKRGIVEVRTDSHCPDELREPAYDGSLLKLSLWFPVLPSVVISRAKKN